MTNVLNGELAPQEATHETPIESLDIMPCGPLPANPAEALTLEELSEVIEWARENYDFVIVDTPPLLMVSDPVLVNAHVDAALMVMRVRRRSKPNGKEAVAMLRGAGARILGVIVNKVDELAGNASYEVSASGSYQSAGYGYGDTYRQRYQRESATQDNYVVKFADFRNYVPGDDLRLIDWNLYARLDQLFLKLFQEEEDLHVYALIDTSESMKFGTPTKLHVAKQMAAALGYIGLCRADRVCVQAMGGEGRRAPVLRGRSGLWQMLQYLDSIQDGENISLHDAVKDFSLRNSGTGVVVILSDLMDKQGFESALRMLVGRRMDVYIMHILSPEEIDPPIRGDRRLIDSEDGDETEITVNAYVLERYKQTLQSFLSSIKSFCSRRSIAYLPVRTDQSVDDVMTRYLRQRGVVR